MERLKSIELASAKVLPRRGGGDLPDLEPPRDRLHQHLVVDDEVVGVRCHTPPKPPWRPIAVTRRGLDRHLSMKEGRVARGSSGHVVGRAPRSCGGRERCSSLYRLLAGGPGRMGASLRRRISKRTVKRSDQRCRGACRSEGLSEGEHVPDRCSEPAG